VHAESLLGDERSVLEQLAELERAGVTRLLLDPVAADPQDRVDDVRRLIELVGPDARGPEHLTSRPSGS
jgi:hypothetical protein